MRLYPRTQFLYVYWGIDNDVNLRVLLTAIIGSTVNPRAVVQYALLISLAVLISRHSV
jgi:hypothetical protein